MPTGQVSPLLVDSATGATLLPGVVLDDDFSVNRLTNYVKARTDNVSNVGTTGLVVTNGQLTSPSGGPHFFRNQKQWTIGRMMWSVIPTNTANWELDVYVKYIDNANWILVQTLQSSVNTLVYKSVAGVVTNLGSTMSAPGPPGSTAGIPVYFVARLDVNSDIGALRVEKFANPPSLGFGAANVQSFGGINPIFGTPGYGGMGFDGVASDWSFGEWIIADVTNRSIF